MTLSVMKGFGDKMNIVLEQVINDDKSSNYIKNEGTLAMQQKNQKLALSIMENQEFDICELIDHGKFIGKENLLSVAVYYGLEEVVDYLLDNEKFQNVINEGNNPYYNLLSMYNKETFEYDISIKKNIFQKMLNNDKLEIPREFPILLQKELENITKFQNNKEENILFLRESIIDILKNPKFEKYINSVFNPYDTYLMFFIKNKNFEAANAVLNSKEFNKLNYDYIHDMLFHHINAATSCFEGTGDIGFIGKNTKIEEEYLYKILLDDRFDIDLIKNVLLTLLIYYGKHNDKQDHTNCLQVQRILLNVINKKQFPKKEENYYDELVFAASLYGNVDVLNLLLQKQNIEISPYIQSLIIDYGIKIYNNPQKDQIKSIIENTVDEFDIIEMLSRHILVYGTCLFGNKYTTKISSLEEKVLQNILQYFEDKEKVKNVLLNMKTEIPCVSIYNKEIEHKKENFMDCNEYELHHCYYPEEKVFIKQLEKCRLIAESLVNSFELTQKSKVMIKK